MALTVVTSGTTAALTVGGPETTLSTQTPGSPTTYVVRVDVAALATGERVALIIYSKTLTGGTERHEAYYSYEWIGESEVILSKPHPTDISFRAALLQLNGTGRTFPWKLFSL